MDIVSERTIPSLLAQSHKNIEVLIVCDGTPAHLLKKLEGLADPRISVVKLNKRGRYPTEPEARWMVAGTKPRNVGAKRAKGEWILWISDDDVLFPDCIETLLKVSDTGCHVGQGPEVVTAAFQAGTMRPRTIRPSDDPGGLGFPVSGPPVFLMRKYLRLFRWNRHSWRKAWNRPCDYDLLNRMHSAGVRFAHTDQTLALQPEVDGTDSVGRVGALKAAAEGKSRDALSCSRRANHPLWGRSE